MGILSAFFAGLTAVFAKCGIRKTDIFTRCDNTANCLKINKLVYEFTFKSIICN